MNYAVEQRMRFIDFMLAHYGYISRNTIIEYFGIAEATATRDFRKYKEIAPGNAVLDDTSKTYKRAKTFSPKFGL